MFESLGVPDLHYAGFWRRLTAAAIDYCVIAVLVAIELLIGLPEQGWLSVVLVLGTQLLYFAPLEASRWQGTIGKKVLGLRVAYEDGTGPVTVGGTVMRYLGRALLTMPFAIGFLVMLFSDRKQTLWDRLTKTVVLEGAPAPAAARSL